MCAALKAGLTQPEFLPEFILLIQKATRNSKQCQYAPHIFILWISWHYMECRAFWINNMNSDNEFREAFWLCEAGQILLVYVTKIFKSLKSQIDVGKEFPNDFCSRWVSSVLVIFVNCDHQSYISYLMRCVIVTCRGLMLKKRPFVGIRYSN